MNNKPFFIFLLMELCAFSFVEKGNDQLILWSKNTKLTWNDFQGKLDQNFVKQNPVEPDQVIEDETRRTIIHTEMDAYCYHQISFNSNYVGDTVTFVVKAMFDKSKSWKNSSSPYILNHEQRHFDLGEVYARKFRQFIHDSVNTFNETNQHAIFSKFLAEDLEAQKKYDSVSNHSISSEGQEYYDQQIDSMLNAYSNYADIKIKKYCPQVRKKR